MPRFVTLVLLLLGATALHSQTAPPPGTYRIGGIVVDALAGQPLGLAEVTLAPVAAPDDSQAFLTAPDGRFLFSNLAPGKYRIMAGRRGYAVQGFNQHETYMTDIVAGPGQDSEHLRFRLSPSAVLTGTVSDQWNDPVREAEVILFQQSWSAGSRNLHPINRTSTNDLGSYRFAHLLPGTYVVGVIAHPWWGNFLSQPTFLPKSAFGWRGNFIASSGSSATNADSSFSSDPAVLEYLQRAGSEAAAPNPALDLVYPVIYFPNSASLSDAVKLSLPAGATETADVSLLPVPSIHLHVRVPEAVPAASQTDATDGEPADVVQTVSGTSIEVSLNVGGDNSNNIPVSRTEISSGLLELSGIPPGEITVTVSGPQGDDLTTHTQSLQLSASTELDLTPHGPLADVSGVVLTPKEANGTQAVGTDQAPSSESPPSFMLEFRSSKTVESYKTPVSNRGEFSFAGSALPPGAYEVGLSEAQSFQVSFLEATGATVSHRTIDIPAGQPVKLTVHTSEAKCSLSGFALKGGKPFAGAMILLVPQDADQNASLFHRDQSDSDGSFSMAPLFPGRYTLLALENGWDLEWSNPAVLFKYLPNGQPVEIRPNATLNLNVKVQ
jgi:Carboxypeptidase regulatory-like domain